MTAVTLLREAERYSLPFHEELEDEIQLIDFSRTRESSFESLMILANRTKVAIAVVGTEDAYEMMFSKFRTGRRVGTVIKAHSC